MAVPLKQESRIEEPKPLRIVKPGERKPETDVKVELGKIRRELLTLAVRIDKVSQGQD